VRVALFHLFIVTCLCSFAQQSFFLKGYIENENTKTPLHGAHVKNLTSRKLTTSGPNGTFDLPVNVGDSIVITYVGYEPFSIVVKDGLLKSRLTISLNLLEVSLEEVVVTPLPEYAEFKQMIIDLDPPDSTLNLVLPKVGVYAFYDPRSAPIGNKEFSPPSVGVSLDFEGLTKRGKEKKKLQKKLASEKKWQLAREKFNRDWVKSLTQLEGVELTDFIAFCDFSADHIIETHIIELKTEILALLKEFKEDQIPSEKNRRFPGA